jgi:pSer/pThr/pTyr-binding forkhead associated (FHA) protein
VICGAKPNSEYPIYEGKNVIGRADQKPVEIDLFAQEAADRVWSSREHAIILCEHGALSIEDLNSTNGTFVNRERVQPGEKKALKTDDVIQIGEVQLKVVMM